MNKSPALVYLDSDFQGFSPGGWSIGVTLFAVGRAAPPLLQLTVKRAAVVYYRFPVKVSDFCCFLTVFHCFLLLFYLFFTYNHYLSFIGLILFPFFLIIGKASRRCQAVAACVYKDL